MNDINETSLNVKIPDNLYTQFKIICTMKKSSVKEEIKKAIELYIKVNKINKEIYRK